MEVTKVIIWSLIYNHAPYIRKCLDGFVMQKTDFPFVAVVHDDASTDGTADIIREYAEKYPDIIKPILETENQYSKHDGSLGRIMNEAIDSHAPKYIAECEGDDFWTDPNKLQRQVDILDADESLMAVVTDTAIVDMDGNVLTPKRGSVVPSNKEGRYNIHDFFKEPTHKYPTASVLYRNTHKEEFERLKKYTANKYLGDWTSWIILHTFGDFYYIDEPMVAYRINPTSVTHTEDKVARALAGPEICAKIADILPPDCAYIAKRLRRKKRERWVSLAHAYLDGHQYAKALGCTALSVFVCPRALCVTVKRVIDRKTGRRSEWI